jgi:hypothetical protein
VSRACPRLTTPAVGGRLPGHGAGQVVVGEQTRRLRIVSLLAAAAGNEPDGRQLCEVSVAVTGVTGAGIMLMSGDMARGSLGTTDDVSELIERLQYTLGEGPCVDAHTGGRPVLEPDLVRPAVARWPAFCGPVVAAGAQAVFGFPLRVGAVRIGALNLYRRRSGTLTGEQHADALVMADVAAESILALQAGAPEGLVSAGLEAGADFHYVVHQASGMVSVQLGTGVGEALTRLRAYAFAHDRSLRQVAVDVVGRRLRFDGHTGEGDPAP